MSEVVQYAPRDVEPVEPGIFQGRDPLARRAAAHRISGPLREDIEKAQLYTVISGKKHIRIEGWTLLAAELELFPQIVWSREIEAVAGGDDGWEARCEVRTYDGVLVSSAEAMCTRSEGRWANRDDHALRSMAQTRAVSKALKLVIGFVFALEGYETTPAEEMPHIEVAKQEERISPANPEPARDTPTKEHRTHFIDLMRNLEGLDPETDWPAWCLAYTGGVRWEGLDRIGAERLIAGLMEKEDELRRPTDSSSSE